MLLAAMYALGMLASAVIGRANYREVGTFFVYYFVPAVTAIVCLLIYRSTKVKEGCLVTFGVILALILTEFLILPNSWNWERKYKSWLAGRDFDTRSLRQVVSDLRQDGRTGAEPVSVIRTPLTLSDGTVANPLGGVSRCLTVSGNETGQRMIYQSDEFGFTNPLGLYERGPLSVCLVGDSFAQGCHVSPEETPAAALRENYPLTLSLGFAGHGPLANLATIREFCGKLKPNYVFWFHYEGNDFFNLSLERDGPLIRYLEPEFSLDLMKKQSLVDEAIRLKQSELEQKYRRRQGLFRVLHEGLRLSMTRRKVSNRINSWITPLKYLKLEQDHDQLPLLVEILRQGEAEVSAGGGQLIFVYLPTYERFVYPDSFDSKSVRVELKRKLMELDIPVIDLTDAFAEESDPLSLFPFRRKGHYTAEGYGLVTRVIREHLEGTSR